MFAGANSGTDAVVRSSNVVTVSGEGQGTRQPVRTDLVSRIEKTPGVAAAVPNIQGAGQLVGSDGKPVGGQGPPTVAGNWIDDPELNPYRLAEGRVPAASGEVMINRGAADKGGLKVGDRTVLRTPDPVGVTVVGLATFGGEDGMGQVTFTGMTRADAEKYLTPKPGEAASIQVRAGPGTGPGPSWPATMSSPARPGLRTADRIPTPSSPSASRTACRLPTARQRSRRPRRRTAIPRCRPATSTRGPRPEPST